MGVPLQQKPVKLFTSIIFRDEGSLDEAERKLVSLYGPTEESKKTLDFSYTDYYREEMGTSLKRKLMCFQRPVDVGDTAEIKLATNRIEDELSGGGKRTVNIDPGYVTEAKLVLLTTKDYTHRIYIGKRIFAEVTLHYTGGTFRAWPWTYPDYASEDFIAYFNGVRDMYMREGRQDGDK